MPTNTTIEEAIENAALSGIAEASEGDRQWKRTALADLIEADRYLASKTATGQKHFGLRYTKLVSPGTG